MHTWTNRLLTTCLVAASALPLAACQTDKGGTWPAFGTYRLPYADGTDVRVYQDFTTHNPLGRYDLKGKNGGPYSAVAAADGWVRYIMDSNIGHQTGDNNYVWIEHPAPYCQAAGVTWPGKPADYGQTCIPCLTDRCNEWTKYSHMSPDSTTVDAGLSVGDWVTAGTFLGYEDDIGHATGDHVHWEVAKLDPAHPFSDSANGWTWDWSGGGWVGSPNVLPSICGVGLLNAGDRHTAGPCPAVSAQASTPLTLSWESPGLHPVAAGALAQWSGPDRSGRLTLSSVQLESPVEFQRGITRVRIDSLRLVRPATVTVNRDGLGRLSADQLIWSIRLTVTSLDGSQARKRIDGPVRGTLEVRLTGGRVSFSLDAGAFGTVRGAGTLAALGNLAALATR
jgi:hypothetical protein